ncbi:MAG TPA: iron ABC transporter permease [Chloroflexota bacterium]|nr:iron ABC transporter permease [Chloroflexota bacterium]
MARAAVHVTPTGVLIGTALLFAAFLCLYPTLMLLRGSLATGRIGNLGTLTLQNYLSVYTSLETYALFGTTVLYAAGVAIASCFVGFVLAWLAVRTNAPAAQHMGWLVFVPYALPSTLTSMGWILLANPNQGFLNVLAQRALGGDGPIVNVYSFPGMVFVASTHAFALAFTFLSASLRLMDPALEEASGLSGAGPLATAWRVSLPLAWPALFSTLAILLILGFESFEVPAFIGIPANIRVFTTQVFVETSVRTPPDYGRAAAYGALPLLLAVGLTYAYQRVVVRPERFATISGKAYRPRRVDLGRWRWVATALFFTVFGISAVLPLLALLLVSLEPTLSDARALELSRLVARHYEAILRDPVAQRAVRNTVTLAVVGATLATAVAFCAAFVTTRTRIRGRAGIEYVLFLPFAVPSVVLAVGVLWGYVAFPVAVYGTIWILMLGYVTKFLPYALRSTSTSLLQVHRELEEGARLSGAGLGQTLARVVLPLAAPGLIAAWSLLVVVFMREFSMSLMLWASGSEVVSVLFYDYWTNGRFGPVSALGVLLIVVSLTIVFGVRRLTRFDRLLVSA